ncbi:MAG: hypothetical protein IH983_09385 [Planctomycetes bacterium]|nr:hypothetical protein [Planctomycetota bacterium]
MIDAQMPRAEDIVIGALCLGGLWFVYQFVWKKSLLDHFRQKLFAIRDELFMDAARGKLAFEDPAYGMLRMLSNSLIRCSASITLTHFIITILIDFVFRGVQHESSLDLHDNFKKCVDGMRSEGNAHIYRAYYNRLIWAAAVHFLLSSVVALSIFIVMLVAVIIRYKIEGVWQRFARLGRRITEVALELDGTNIAPAAAA